MNKSSQQGSLMPLKRLLLLASLLVGCADNDEQNKQLNTETQDLNSENTELHIHQKQLLMKQLLKQSTHHSPPLLKNRLMSRLLPLNADKRLPMF